MAIHKATGEDPLFLKEMFKRISQLAEKQNNQQAVAMHRA